MLTTIENYGCILENQLIAFYSAGIALEHPGALTESDLLSWNCALPEM